MIHIPLKHVLDNRLVVKRPTNYKNIRLA